MIRTYLVNTEGGKRKARLVDGAPQSRIEITGRLKIRIIDPANYGGPPGSQAVELPDVMFFPDSNCHE